MANRWAFDEHYQDYPLAEIDGELYRYGWHPLEGAFLVENILVHQDYLFFRTSSEMDKFLIDAGACLILSDRLAEQMIAKIDGNHSGPPLKLQMTLDELRARAAASERNTRPRDGAAKTRHIERDR